MSQESPRHQKDRAIFKNNMAWARRAEIQLQRQREALGLPQPLVRIGNVIEIRFKKK